MRPLVVLLALAAAARADGFADDLRYRGQPLSGLLNALRNGDRSARLAASRALTRVGPEALDAAPALLMALKTDDDTVRARVADALARVGAQAVPLLTAALTFDDDRIRTGAARALRRLGPDARPALRALRYSFARAASPSSRLEFLEAIWAVTAEPTLLDDAAALIRQGGIPRQSATFLHRYGREVRPLIEALVEQLDTRTPTRREAARAALLAIGHESLPAIVQALKGGSATARLEAADLLGRFHPPAAYAAPALRTAFPRGTPGVRAAIARSLGRIGDRPDETAVHLRPGLTDKSADVRAECAAALGQLRVGAAAGALAKLLADDDPGVMTAARTALGRLGRAAVPALIEAARGSDDLARGHALRALAAVGPGARDAALTLTNLAAERRSPVAPDAVAALERVGAVEALIKLAWDGTAADERAVAALGRLGAVTARETLLAALADRNLDRRRVVIEALGRVGPHDPALLLREGMNPALRPASLMALARLDIPTRDASPLVLRAMRLPEQQEAALTFLEWQGLDGVPTSELLHLVDGEDRRLARRATDVMRHAGRADALLQRLTAKVGRGEPLTASDVEIAAWLRAASAPHRERLKGAMVADDAREAWDREREAWDDRPLNLLLADLRPDRRLTDRLRAVRWVAAQGAAARPGIALLVRLRADIGHERVEAEQAFDDLLSLGREGEMETPDAGELLDAEGRRLLAEAIGAGRRRAPGSSTLARAALRSIHADHLERVDAALRAVGANDHPTGRTGLVRLIHHEPAAALTGLTRLGRHAAGFKPLLARYLSHPDAEVRHRAAAALAAVEGDDAPGVVPGGYAARIDAADAEGLAGLLTEPLRPSLRVRALSRLAGMGRAARAGLAPVQRLLDEPVLEAEVREAALKAAEAAGG